MTGHFCTSSRGMIACIIFSCWYYVLDTINYCFLCAENPFIRRQTPEVLTVVSGEEVLLSFQVAINSNGQQSSAGGTQALFTFTNNDDMVTTPVPFVAMDPAFPQHFSLVFEEVAERNEGIYTARALGVYVLFHPSHRQLASSVHQPHS